MEIEYFVENYNTLPVSDRKTYISRLVKSKELGDIYIHARGANARAATRILADMGDRIRDSVSEDPGEVLALLKSGDAKVRMHAAQIIGNTCPGEHLEELIEAFSTEDTMFALPSYILAIGSAKSPRAKQFLEEYIPRSEVEKHLYEEKAALQKALSNYVSKTKPKVRILPSDVILLTSPNARVTFEALQSAGMSPKRVGDYVAVSKLGNFNDIYKTRAFVDAYIFLGNCGIDELPAFLAGRQDAIIQRAGATAYRLEVKSVAHEVRLDIIKKCVAACGKLVNSPSSYSIEVLIDMRGDVASVLLNPLVDKRFAYRKKSVAASINPGVAACVCAFASEFFDPDARILDNFCGSGTMLFERAQYPHFKLTGVDLSIEAINAAEENSRFASVHPQFHRMDALKFTGKEYDEVITNMPFGIRVGNHARNEKLYTAYFGILPKILREGGIAVLYSHEKHLCERLIKQSGAFHLLKRATFSAGGLYPSVYILRKI